MSSRRGESADWAYEPTGTEVLQGRFKVSYEHLLGEGSFARVYKALDMEASKQVAVKIWKPGDDEDTENAILNLKKCVDVIDAVASKSALGDDGAEEPDHNMGRRASFSMSVIEEDAKRVLSGKADTVVTQMDLRKCFVQILGYSKDRHGEPGLDIDSEKVWVVTELGQESLNDFLSKTAAAGKTLEADILRVVHWSLVSIACALHAAGFVHLDIKPLNVMRFGEVWKLIDFDGAVRTRSSLQVSDLFVTEWYMPPEVARALIKSMEFDQNEKETQVEISTLEVSRLMDVWSVGLSALEGVFLQPVLRPFYEDWLESTGTTEKFIRWLSDYEETFIDGDMREFMDNVDKDMSSFLQGMLTKDPADRICIAESLVHPWFEPIRSKMWTGFVPQVSPGSAETSQSLQSSHLYSSSERPHSKESGKSSKDKGNFRPSFSMRSSRTSGSETISKTPSLSSRARASLFGRASSYQPSEDKASRACAMM